MLKNELLRGAKGAAEYSGLTERQIYHMTDQGLLPYTKVGSALYFRKSDIDATFRPKSNAA
jgi:excisionase family DNA binding protein